jgi:hypothetical protein
MNGLFAQTDELFDTFGDADSAQFMCWSYPSFMLRRSSAGRGITRELRGGTADECCVRLTLNEADTPWSLALTKRLARAGYRPCPNDGLQRAWHGARERDRELAFASSLGVLGTPARWPERSPSAKARPARSISEVRDMIAAARRARIRWHHVASILTRQVVSSERGLSAIVYVLCDNAPHLHGQDVELGVMTKSTDAKRLNRARVLMRSHGFDGGRPPQAWFGNKHLRSIGAALRARDSILKRLMAL